jgi:uncharacterized protein YqgQ
MIHAHELLKEIEIAVNNDDRQAAIREMKDEIDRLEFKLREQSDYLADRGIVINTPGSKLNWIES